MIKQYIKRAFNTCGFEVLKFSPHASSLARLMAGFGAHKIDIVFDVGANEGQFSTELRQAGFSGHIVSFEPLSEAHRRLTNLSRGDPKWNVHSRCALGDRNGTVEINVAGNSVSSSIFPMLDLHSSAAPDSVYIRTETVPLLTLDDVAGRYLEDMTAPFLKVDTQGYEWLVLDGANMLLTKLRGIQMELTTIPLYEGQRLWRESIDRLEDAGFSLWSLQPAFVDPRDGRTLQWDGLFFREK